MRKPEYREEKTREIMEKCYECYCDNGLRDTGIKELGRYCGMTSANLYSYFPCVDDIIVKSTAHCMAQVEQEFMAKAPENIEELYRFIEEVPYWAAEKYGKKYRLMYQVYTHPKYIEHGKKFFEGVNERYTEYAQRLSPKLGISVEELSGFIFLFVRATVHYAMFEDEFYLKTQIKSLKTLLSTILNKGQNK
ncbi:MAG: TetR/AcrR family transcriptional regulator [Clostridiales bacterium]|jgi:AcrR family transcriptional regulator|nr:TetR/AcrR family transcriptional regulator [Clostridiales bacterium]